MGYPGEGMPVGGIEIKKGPFEKSEIKRAYVWVLKNVVLVVPQHERILERRKIDDKRHQRNWAGKVVLKVLSFHPPGYLLTKQRRNRNTFVGALSEPQRAQWVLFILFAFERAANKNILRKAKKGILYTFLPFQQKCIIVLSASSAPLR
jgi:hypothetical protein